MKKTAITCLLSLSMIGGIGTSAMAAPVSLSTAKAKVQTEKTAYQKATQNVNDAETSLEQISNEISNLTQDISKTNSEIATSKTQLAAFTAEYNAALKIEAARIKSIYQNDNNNTYLSALITSKNLGQFISRAFDINRLMQIDAKAVQKTQAAKNSMDAEQTKLENLKASNEAQLKILNEKKATAQALLTKMQSDKSATAANLAAAQTAEENAANAQMQLLASAKTVTQVNTAVSALKHLETNITSSAVKSKVNAAINNSQNTISKIQSKPTPASVQSAPAATPAPATKSTPVAKPTPAPVASQGSSEMQQEIVSYAMNFLGDPYVWGAKGPNSFDCSGLTSYVYNHFGYGIGDSTYTQIDEGTPVTPNVSDLEVGDLIFWGNPSAPYHVAIYIGGGEYIQAPHTGANVDISSWNINNISAARRIL